MSKHQVHASKQMTSLGAPLGMLLAIVVSSGAAMANPSDPATVPSAPLDSPAANIQPNAAMETSDVDSPRWTVMTVFIDQSGGVADIKVKNSSGSPKLDTAAMRYIKDHWRWSRPGQHDVAVPPQTEISVKWVPKH
jgi:TonB family protein